jgi:hypothetical protein
MIKDILNFQGGYHTDTLNELMKDNELRVAENCQWRNGLQKRNGLTKYSTTNLSAFTGMRGGIRVYINSAWTTIAALDTGSVINFYQGTGTTIAAIDNTYAFTTGYNVEFSALNEFIIAVNGVDKPAIIYYSSGFLVKNLETYDTRTRTSTEWDAGQYTAVGTVFTDDSTDAQDAGTDDFQVCSTTNGDGCFISCDLTFNKVIFKGCQQAAGSPASITYQYWNGTAWTSLTLTSTPAWTTAEGDKTLEFNIPLDSNGEFLWEPYDQSTATYLSNKYVILILFGTAPSSAFSADYLQVYHTQYLTQIMENERPQFVITHNSRIVFAASNTINMSPYNSVTGWREGEIEYFGEGGKQIISMISYFDALLVFKEDTIFLFTGTSYENWQRSRSLSHIGTIANRSPVMVGRYVFFVAIDGIYAWDGNEAVKISKHIKTDITSYTLTNACGICYQNEYWVSFPTNSVTLSFDPDTIRDDEMGDKRASFFKFLTYKVHGFIYNKGSGDNGYLLGIVDQATPYIARCDYGAVDNLTGSDTAIDMKMQTRYFDWGHFMLKKYIGRIWLKIKQVSGSTGATHTLTIYSDDGTVNTVVTLTVSTGTGFYKTLITPPYTCDGKNLSFHLRHNAATAAALTGFSLEVKERSFTCL